MEGEIKPEAEHSHLVGRCILYLGMHPGLPREKSKLCSSGQGSCTPFPASEGQFRRGVCVHCLSLGSRQSEFGQREATDRWLPLLSPGGVDTEAVGAVFDISNADRLGSSEVDQVQLVVDGVKLMVEMEKKLEKGQAIDDMVPAQK